MINLCFFINTDDFEKYHRKSEILHFAKKLDTLGGRTIVFSQPQFILKRNKIVSSHFDSKISVKALYSLIPLTIALRSNILMKVFVKLPIYIQYKLHTRMLRGKLFNWIYKPDQYLYLPRNVNFIYLQYDNYMMDEGYSYNRNRQYLQTEARLKSECSLLLFTSLKLLDEHNKKNDNKVGYYYPNAISRSLISRAALKKQTSESVRTIGFVGKIDQSFDVNLVLYLAKNLGNVKIVLVGPIVSKDVADKLHSEDNIVTMGFVPYEKLSNYIVNFNVGICPYKQDQFSIYRNPLKVYEYFALGLSVITTNCDLSDEVKDLLYMAEDYKDFVRKVELALTKNTLELIESRIEFAERNCWDDRVEFVFDALKKMETSR